ncbi:TPA: hypothetical protein RG395_001070 [Legionella pneumophila]|nr:hypothetical protein [Legionella pneumophila]MDW9168796.1 hypothetical protein [Legionella pneumophila subsp. fraseri]MDX1847663.1 hypothetical protein [Legionella pneumophila subsp. fraseri]HAT1773469.1 hypothetical protein [Legionella pneumophila]HAT1845486.1 hypothetical protein [Legionella pneumophila]HAT1860116.1 hypothetical protein [Legionella pneumophila]
MSIESSQYNYDALTVEENKKNIENAFSENQNEKFKVKNSTFVVFSDKGLDAKAHKEMESNWKIHLSVAPEDIGKAWDLAYPLLHDKAAQFKVVDMTRAIAAKDRNLRQLDTVKHEKEIFIQNYEKGELNLEQLKQQAGPLTYGREEWEPYATDAKTLYEFLLKKHDEKIQKCENMVKENDRIIQGMQITIYIPPGQELEMHKLAQEIEQRFQENNIKKGTIYPTDNPLGDYASYRHPGLEYQDAVAIDTYNPDNLDDPLFLASIDNKINSLKELCKKTYDLEYQTLIKDSITLLETVKQAYQNNNIPQKQAIKITEASYHVAAQPSIENVNKFKKVEYSMRDDSSVPLNVKTGMDKFLGSVYKFFGNLFNKESWKQKGDEILRKVEDTEKFKSDFKQFKSKISDFKAEKENLDVNEEKTPLMSFKQN